MGKTTSIKYLAIVSCVLLFLSMAPIHGHAEGSQSAEIQTQIDALEKQEQALLEELASLEGKLNSNAQALSDAVEQKNLLDQQIVLLHDQIKNANDQIATYTQLIADKQQELEEALAQQDALQAKHKDRIRAMEERGKMTYWTILFRATSFTDLLDRMNMIQEIAAADKRNLDDLRKTSAKVLEMKEDMEKKRSELSATRDQLAQSQQELESKRKESDSALQTLVAKGEEYERLLDESEKKQEELMAQLAQKKSDFNKAAYEEWLAGSQEEGNPKQYDEDKWITPVKKYTLTSPFGMRFHPVLKVDRMHNGVDMACPANTPIYAARGGLVITAAYQKDGAGNYVQIDHGDGYRSIYMHMTRYIVKKDEYVAPGQVIGYVGSTGISTGNHLHFGISKNGTYVNPMQYVS